MLLKEGFRVVFLRLAGWKGKGWLDSWKGSVARDAPSGNAQEALFSELRTGTHTTRQRREPATKGWAWREG